MLGQHAVADLAVDRLVLRRHLQVVDIGVAGLTVLDIRVAHRLAGDLGQRVGPVVAVDPEGTRHQQVARGQEDDHDAGRHEHQPQQVLGVLELIAHGEPPLFVRGERLGRRRGLLAALDQEELGREPGTQAMGQFQQQAFDLIARARGRSAFDLAAEPVRLRDRYGRNRFGQGCLLARRLIEAGVRFVTVTDGGWDTHQNNFVSLKT
ncbi:MAG: DUF1501 domain-containing protein, partial [Chloroflexi bacterium]|nr:DUF1501 domain-containing protein [Chloroflexota bacterium]